MFITNKFKIISAKKFKPFFSSKSKSSTNKNHSQEKFIFLSVIFLTLFSFGIILTSCSKKKEEKKESSSYSGIAAQALTNMDTVESNYTPDSMKSDSSTASGSSFKLNSSNVCEGLDLFSCQPVLLKLYIDIGKQYLGLMKKLLAGLSSLLTNVADGGAGSVTGTDYTVSYSKTNANIFSVLAKNSSNDQSYIYFSSNDTTYQLSLDFGQMPTSQRDAETPTQGKLSVTLTYTDASHWTISILGVGFACKDADPAAPSQLKITMHMNDQLWIGKAMLYNGHWIMTDNTSPTCSTTEADAISANIYTEFVADKIAAKSNVYLMNRGTSDFPAQSANYSLNNICNNYSTNIASKGGNSATCSAVTAIWTNNKIGTYLNPFCSKATNSAEAIWNSNCSDTSTLVSEANFDDAEVPWISPNTFYTNTITLPNSL